MQTMPWANHYIGIGVVTEIVGDPKLLKPADWDSWEWHDINNPPENLFPPARNLIDCIRQCKVNFQD